jgi:hypothetical protein
MPLPLPPVLCLRARRQQPRPQPLLFPLELRSLQHSGGLSPGDDRIHPPNPVCLSRLFFLPVLHPPNPVCLSLLPVCLSPNPVCLSRLPVLLPQCLQPSKVRIELTVPPRPPRPLHPFPRRSACCAGQSAMVLC